MYIGPNLLYTLNEVLMAFRDSKIAVCGDMRSMTFGISCAPCTALYVRDKKAEEYKLQGPRALKGITKAHYIDDCIDSLSDETKAIKVTLKVRDIHAAGGYNTTNLASNSSEVLKHFQGDSLVLQSPKELGVSEKSSVCFGNQQLT